MRANSAISILRKHSNCPECYSKIMSDGIEVCDKVIFIECSNCEWEIAYYEDEDYNIHKEDIYKCLEF